MDATLKALVAAQNGVVSTGQARDIGLNSRILSRLVAQGRLVRVRHGVYAAGDLWHQATPSARYLLRVRAVALSRFDATMSHQSALVLHDLPLFDVDLSRVHVRSSVAHEFRTPGVITRPHVTHSAWQRIGGIQVVSVAQSIVDVALNSGLMPALVAADAALHRGVVTRVDLDALVPSPGARGATRMARLVAQADPSCESPGETRTRVLLTGLGLRVRSQVVLRSRANPDVRVDFLVEDKVIVEFDGAVKYSRADGREALIAEKLREDRLRASGFEVVRLTWSDLANPGPVSARILAAVERAR